MKLRNRITLLMVTAGLAASPLAQAETAAKKVDTAAQKATAAATTMQAKASSNGAQALDANQKAQVERIVHEYLIKNPQILIQMTQLLQQQQMKSQQEKILNAIPDQAEKLFNMSSSPVSGNKEGSITLVEFFDYQCGHCRRMTSTIKALPEKHENLRIIHKTYPIFGAESEFASRAALASKMQGKFDAMHTALMEAQPPLDKKKVLDAAKAAGLDTKKLQKDMKAPEINEEISTNYELANALGIKGTPSFIISNPAIPASVEGQKDKEVIFLPGAVDAETLDNMINKFN